MKEGCRKEREEKGHGGKQWKEVRRGKKKGGKNRKRSRSH